MGGVLYGVCGIGRGHVVRQMPVIRALAASRRVVVLAYGQALAPLRELAARMPDMTVLEVAVPYLPGGPRGIDWASAAQAASGLPDPWRANGQALARVEDLLAVPDLAVSDYEPVAASYAYASGAPLVTLDQQSKLLVGDIARSGPGGRFGAEDEIARLRMFFPKAALRLACSFFPVTRMDAPHEEVRVVPPLLREEILGMRRRIEPGRRDVLVYLSPQADVPGGLDLLADTLSARADVRFHVSCRGELPDCGANVSRVADEGSFLRLLASADALVCTAGHGLLSEAVYLGIPALAVPLPLHEQHLNAERLAASGAGMSADAPSREALAELLERIPQFRERLASGASGLVRGEDAQGILARLRPWLPDP